MNQRIVSVFRTTIAKPQILSSNGTAIQTVSQWSCVPGCWPATKCETIAIHMNLPRTTSPRQRGRGGCGSFLCAECCRSGRTRPPHGVAATPVPCWRRQNCCKTYPHVSDKFKLNFVSLCWLVGCVLLWVLFSRFVYCSNGRDASLLLHLCP